MSNHQDLMMSFTASCIEAGKEKARRRGVPERFIEETNLSPTGEETMALVSYGDGKTILAEFTQREWADLLGKKRMLKHPQTQNKLYLHSQYRESGHSFEGEIGNEIFIIPCSPSFTVEWLELTEVGRTPVESAKLQFHMNGTVSFSEYYSDNSQKSAPVRGDKPRTEKLLEELGIALVMEWRPVTPEQEFDKMRSEFLVLHQPSEKKQSELQKDFTQKGWIKP